jgi:hypothetical protein
VRENGPLLPRRDEFPPDDVDVFVELALYQELVERVCAIWLFRSSPQVAAAVTTRRLRQ